MADNNNSRQVEGVLEIFWRRVRRTKSNQIKVMAYLGLAVFAVGFYSVGFVNLASELIGAFLIFLIVDLVFGLESSEKELDKLDQIEARITQAESRLAERLMNQDSCVIERDTLPQFIELMKNASEIYAIGAGMNNLLENNINTILDRVRSGAECRFLLLNRDSDDAVRRRDMARDLDSAIARSEGHLNYIRENLRENPGSGKFDWRHTKRVPDYSVTMIDPSQDHGVIRIVFYSMTTSDNDHLGSKQRPCFMLRKAAHPGLFKYFDAQFNELWGSQQPAQTSSSEAAAGVANQQL